MALIDQHGAHMTLRVGAPALRRVDMLVPCGRTVLFRKALVIVA